MNNIISSVNDLQTKQWVLLNCSDLENVPTYLENAFYDAAIFRQSLAYHRDLLMYSLGETVQERCMDQPTKSKKLASGTHLISEKKGCILSSDKG